MGVSGLDQTILTSVIRGTITERQARFLYEILACSSPTALAGGRVSLRNTLSLSLPMLVDSLTSFVSTGQPERKFIEHMRDASIQVVDRLKSLFPDDGELASLQEHLRELIEFDALIEQNKTGIVSALKVLRTDLEATDELIAKLAVSVWSGNRGISDFAVEQVAYELGSLWSQLQADYSGLVALVRNLARSPGSKTCLQSIITPPLFNFKVVVAVTGAKRLEQLDKFLENVLQFTYGREESAAWGLFTERLREFTRQHAAKSSVVFLQLRVSAVDRQSASRKVRRLVSEVLDQYVAGHRLTDLRLSAGAIVLDCDRNSAAKCDELSPGVATASPLSLDWPLHLRESLRMGHLAVLGNSPLTQIALTWSAFEAAGFSSSNLSQLASALTLQTLRHQMNESYMYLRQGYLLKVKALECIENEFFERWKNAQYHLDNCTNPNALFSLRQKIQILDQEQSFLSDVFGDHEMPTGGFDNIDAYIDSDSRGYPISINRWADLMQPKMQVPGVVAGEAHLRVRELQKALAGVHLTQLTNWQRRLADPDALEQWFAEQHQRFELALHRIYTARNVVLHTGVLSVRGDVLIADSAIAIVDLFHEVLGNWSRVSTALGLEGESRMKPGEVVDTLAERLGSVVDRVKKGQSECVNFDHLTSPTSTSTDRTWQKDQSGSAFPLDQTQSAVSVDADISPE